MSGTGRNLEGKTVAVLGASSPHGAATVGALAREGANVALGGRSREKLEALEKEVREAGGQAVVVGVHLAKRHHLVHLMEAAVEAFGGLDVLLFMAHTSAPPLESFDVDAWERSVDVNVKGFLYAVAAALPVMREGDGGLVVYVGAGEPEAPDPLYRAGQAAARTLLRELAREFHAQGVRAGEVYLEDRRRVSPEQCAEAVRGLVVDAPDVDDIVITTLSVPET